MLSVGRFIAKVRAAIGTTAVDTDHALYVTETVNSERQTLLVENLGTGNASCEIRANVTGNQVFIRAFRDGHATKADRVEVGTSAGSTSVVILVGSTDAIICSPTGRVGVGRTASAHRFEVEGRVFATVGFNINGTNGATGTDDLGNVFEGGIIKTVGAGTIPSTPTAADLGAVVGDGTDVSAGTVTETDQLVLTLPDGSTFTVNGVHTP